MLKRITLLAIVAALVAATIHARSDVTKGWSRIESANFEFLGNADEPAIRKVAGDLERFRAALGEVFTLPQQVSKTRVIVFRDDASFRSFKPIAPDGTPDEKVAAFFIPGEDVNTIAMSADGKGLSAVYHEYVHNVVAGGNPTAQIPPWLNEGLAEVFERFNSPDDSTIVFGGARPTFVRLLEMGPLIPWKEFFALDNFTLHQDSAAARPMFYAQAWAITASLIARAESDRKGGRLDPETLQRLISQAEGRALDDAVKNVVAAPPTAVRRLPPSAAVPSLISATLSEAASNAILGDLLYRQRNDSAETYLKNSIALDPKLSDAYSTLGQLRFRERKFSEAKALFERAAALDSKSHLVHYYSGFLLLRENLDAAGMIGTIDLAIASKIREAVSRSIALNPKFAESYNLLATVEAASGNLAAAERAIRKAVELRPGTQGYSLMLAQVLLRQERVSDSVAIARQLLVRPSDSRIKAEAQKIVDAADELASAAKSAGSLPRLVIAGNRQTVILKYSDLTPEQVDKIDKDRENYNYNVLVDRPGPEDGHLVGYIERIVCGEGDSIEFRFRGEGKSLRLTTRKFDDVRFRVAVPGTRSFAFRCGSQFPDDLALAVYRPGTRPASGALKAVTFVPKSFVFLSQDEMLAAPFYVIEGRPPADVSKNESIAAAEREMMMREMQATRLRDIEERLRQPQPGEERILGVPEKLECSGGRMSITVRVGNGVRTFSAPIASQPEVQSYNSEVPVVEVGCRSQLPPVTAVITYRSTGNELVSLEFVPADLKLP
ncbi:MAG TPA: tetratricopeptide repeat protein [Pyrinomonadaceae bacterium]